MHPLNWQQLQHKACGCRTSKKQSGTGGTDYRKIDCSSMRVSLLLQGVRQRWTHGEWGHDTVKEEMSPTWLRQVEESNRIMR
ncbi:hypothetical protein MUK42_07375 [Musa troglodytarum]|uniref:Uncharacterized protein n=1 Tax=Musa troglodytarum TaxID=320322 RepID=A0A9E7H9W5_9LILI|nr:hypothetical protein MUK42_07375 [Musa troglodytarum]